MRPFRAVKAWLDAADTRRYGAPSATPATDLLVIVGCLATLALFATGHPFASAATYLSTLAAWKLTDRRTTRPADTGAPATPSPEEVRDVA